MQEFNKNFYTLENDEIRLELIDVYQGNTLHQSFYWWNIINKSSNETVGKISFRIGYNKTSYYNGHIGYEVDEKYRGNHYAYKACLLLSQVCKYYNMDYLYLTCDYDNIASFKTIEKLNVALIEEVVPPKDYIYYYDGIKKQKIYKWKIE